MSTQKVLRSVIYILSSPLIVISRFLILINYHDLRSDLCQCIDIVDRCPPLPERYIKILIAAEDHRNSIHPGVDPISILRVIILWLRTGKHQGASTIDQQFVRIITSRYELTLKRKIREQVLAIALRAERSRILVANAYLYEGYYGANSTKAYLFSSSFYIFNAKEAQSAVLRLISQLKYPAPHIPDIQWRQKIIKRMAYIQNRFEFYEKFRFSEIFLHKSAINPFATIYELIYRRSQ